jgi:hypothetical protein
MATFILWIILAFISFPLAIAVLLLYPIIWLFLLPFRLLGFAVGAVFEILKGIILFPFKILHII